MIVLGDGEDLFISKEEWLLLEKGPKFCVVKRCTEEQMECDAEVAIVKEKWDRMGRDEDEECGDLTPEESVEKEE